MGEAVGMAAGASAILTFLGTRFWDAYRMEKKFRTNEAAEKCMSERAMAEKTLKAKIEELRSETKPRLILGNLIMARLCQELKIPESEIRAFEKAVGIKINGEPYK